MKNPWRTLIHRIVVMYRNNSISRLFQLKYQFNKVIIENRQNRIKIATYHFDAQLDTLLITVSTANPY